jgi:hypothetical protein
VTVFADSIAARAFHVAQGGAAMNAGMPGRADRIEQVFRGVLALALLAGVVWALAHGAPGGSPLAGAPH